MNPPVWHLSTQDTKNSEVWAWTSRKGVPEVCLEVFGMADNATIYVTPAEARQIAENLLAAAKAAEEAA